MTFVRCQPSILRLAMLCASAVVVSSVAAASGVTAHAKNGKITFGSGKARFAPPPGFTPLSAEQRKHLLPTADPRGQVIGDYARGSTVVYLVLEIKLARTQLDQFRRYLTETFTTAGAEITWRVNKLDTVGGSEGIRMEFADGRQMHHISLVGHLDDEHAVMLTYNTPLKELPTLEPALRASIASLEIAR